MPESRCTFGAPAPNKALLMASEGKKLFRKRKFVFRVLTVLPPSSYDFDLCEPTEEMHDALGALFSLIYDFQERHNHLAKHLFFSGNEYEWNLIYRWLEFFVEKCLQKQATSWKAWDFQERVLFAFPLIFLGPGHCHWDLQFEAASLIEKTPNVFRVVFQAWSFANISLHSSLPLHTRTVYLFWHAVNDFDAGPDTVFIQAFLKASFDPVQICMTFLDAHVSKRMPGVSFRALEYVATFMGCLTDKNESSIYESLLRAGALESVTNTVRRISMPEVRDRVPEIDRKSYFYCVVKLHRFIFDEINSDFGKLPEMAKVLDCRWLQAVQNLAYFIESEDEIFNTRTPFLETLACGIVEVLVKEYISFPSILRRFVKYTDRALAEDAKAFDFSGRSGLSKFANAWKGTIKKAKELDAMRKRYAEVTIICASKKCSTTPEQDHLVQACSQCRSKVYCSQTCQREDWSAGHREVCRQNVLTRPFSSSALSPYNNNYDTTFFTYIMEQIVPKHIRNIRYSLVSHIEYHYGDAWGKIASTLMILRFFVKKKSDVPCTCGGYGYSEVDEFDWSFCRLKDAPETFVDPVGKGSALKGGEFRYYAVFPQYRFSGVYNLFPNSSRKEANGDEGEGRSGNGSGYKARTETHG